MKYDCNVSAVNLFSSLTLVSSSVFIWNVSFAIKLHFILQVHIFKIEIIRNLEKNKFEDYKTLDYVLVSYKLLYFRLSELLIIILCSIIGKIVYNMKCVCTHTYTVVHKYNEFDFKFSNGILISSILHN